MLVRCETKSNRVKGLSFHPILDWILASLHNGVIQLWDFRIGALIHRYEEHEGPVRGICFHNSQPVFVSGGDDYKIKVWNYAQQRCLFTLLGHLDYVRTVQFHPEYPWILSASDDQTVRIWNWQNRSCIAVLAGHNHYVMCAQFHPKQDLLISASLDQTLRVWDVSGLKEKTYTILVENNKLCPLQGTSATSGNLLLLSAQQADMFGATDAVCKFVLDGHDRGVNWATFHPAVSLIASGGDDRTVRMWRYNDSKWWEVDTFRGHLNNVSCVVFHPTKEILISNSEDRTIRIWDITKRILIHTYRRENDRFWALASIPGSNTLAVGHDSGAVIFKLNRERIPAQAVDNRIFYVKDEWLCLYDCTSHTKTTIVSCKHPAKTFLNGWQRIFVNVLNTNSIDILLLHKNSDSTEYDLLQFPSVEAVIHSPNKATIQHGTAKSVAFLTRNRFALLDSYKALSLYTFHLDSCKRLELPVPATEIFYAGTNRIFLKVDETAYLYDVQSKKILTELSCPGSLRYVAWSPQFRYVALICKHYITLATSNLDYLCSFYETIRIKGGAWDDTGVFVFSTLSHIKYCFPNGDSGILRCLTNPFYILQVKQQEIIGFDRKTRDVTCLKVNCTEYKLKWALLQKKYNKVGLWIRNGQLCGNAIVGYLRSKGFSNIALQFVTDHRTRFNLALESGNLALASTETLKLDDKSCWETLGIQALRQGNFEIAETAFQNAQNYSKLSFLCFLLGDTIKLRKMLKIVNLQNDFHSCFYNALLLGDIEERIRLLTSMGQIPLAFLTARLYGLNEICEALKPALEGIDVDISISPNAVRFSPPQILVPITEEDSENGAWNWPKITTAEPPLNQLCHNLANYPLSLTKSKNVDHQDFLPEECYGDDKIHHDTHNNNIDEIHDVQDTAAWMDLDQLDDSEFHTYSTFEINDSNQTDDASDEDFGSETLEAEISQPRKKLKEFWCRGDAHVYDYVAAGHYQEALRILSKRIALINPKPLKSLFRLVTLSTFVSLPLLPLFPIKRLPLLRSGTLGKQNHKPLRYFTLASLRHLEKQGSRFFTAGKLNEALQAYTQLLQTGALVKAENEQEVSKIQELIHLAASYALAMRLECHRQTLPASEAARNVELAVYLGSIKLDLVHQFLTWRRSLTVAWKAKNFLTAAAFARKLIETDFCSNIQGANEAVSQAKKALAVSEARGYDSLTIDYDPYNIDSLTICSTSLSRINVHHKSVQCPFCGSRAKADYDGTLCSVCQLSKLGSQALGLSF